MNWAIVRKTARDSAALLIIVCAALVVVEILLVGVLQNFQDEMKYMWLQKEFFQKFAGMLLGANLGGDLTSTALISIGMVHPVMLTLTWSFVLATSSRVIVAEIERGTADVLFTLPVSRARIYASVSVVWIVAIIPLSVAPAFGIWIGQNKNVFPLLEPIDPMALCLLAINAACLSLCIGCAGLMASAWASRRTVAVGWILGWLLASFLLNFLAQFWDAVQPIARIGLMHYYRPLPIVRSLELPTGDICVLVIVSAALWTIGLWRFCRRDIQAA
jgi:ABC-type transport system involved in multi-copper enzyme maturation permease subunit